MVYKAVVLGASGGIGQPLSLLLFKLNKIIDELSLYDIVNAPGVAADLSHINLIPKVDGYLPKDDGLKKALTGANIVVIPAGVPRKPGMTRDDLFNINAGIVRDLAKGIAEYCPNAFIMVISNPVNSTVPIIAEVLKKAGVFNPQKLFGVTTLDIIRANTFTSKLLYSKMGMSKPNIMIPVIGGHSGVTIIPLLSQIFPPTKFNDTDIDAITQRVQFGGDEVVKAKEGSGSATLSMAQAAATFVESLFKACMGGSKGITECSYVCLDADPEAAEKIRKVVGDLDYFAVPVVLGPKGIEKIHPLGPLSDYEQELLDKALPVLQENIKKGVEFARNSKL